MTAATVIMADRIVILLSSNLQLYKGAYVTQISEYGAERAIKDSHAALQ